MFHYICLESLRFTASILCQTNLLNCQDSCLPFGCTGDKHAGYIQFFLF